MADHHNNANTPMYPPSVSPMTSSTWGSTVSYANGAYPTHPAAMPPPLPPQGAPPLPAYHVPAQSYGPSSGPFPPPSPSPGGTASSGQSQQMYAYSGAPGGPLQPSFATSSSSGIPTMSSFTAPSYGTGQLMTPPGLPPGASVGTQGLSMGSQGLPPGAMGHPPPTAQPMLGHHHASIYTGPYMPPPPAAAGIALVQAAEVKLEISCKNLRDRDVITKSDPCAVVFLEEKRYGAPSGYPGMPTGGPPAQQHAYLQMENASAASPHDVTHWREIGRTESIKDNLNPHFSVHVTVPYRFEELQNIRIGIWDIDTRSKELHTHDFLGDIRTTLGDLVSSGITEKELSYPNMRDQKKLLGGRRNLGKIIVIVHENRDGGKLLVKGRFSGRKLAKRDLFSSDPYIIFTQLGVYGEQSRSQVHRTEVVHRNRNPVWKPVKFKVDLPKGSTYSHIKLELLCNDKDQLSCDDEIGIATCTLEELLSTEKLPLIYTKKKGWRGYRDAGTIIVNDCSAVRMPSLVEYLQGGLRLHFSVAVDLTASNGDPRDQNSLHYQGPSAFGANQYIHALQAIGNILRQYVPTDNMFAAYGFGAELPGQAGVASSCFPLNLGHDARCQGIEGIRAAYQRVLQTVRLSGPTNFSPLIEEATRTATARRNDNHEQNYDVLLIITDGVVTDFNRTVEKIIDASYTAPLSIIIIGVGNADFRKMETLDADNELLKSVDGKRTAARDIVQFVPLREFASQPPDRLGSAVLAEMPENIVDYFISSRTPAIMPGQHPIRPDGGAVQA